MFQTKHVEKAKTRNVYSKTFL